MTCRYGADCTGSEICAGCEEASAPMKPAKPTCSFCGAQGVSLAAGVIAKICRKCAEVCIEVINEHEAAK